MGLAISDLSPELQAEADRLMAAMRKSGDGRPMTNAEANAANDAFLEFCWRCDIERTIAFPDKAGRFWLRDAQGKLHEPV
jgi:hypothetical protein